MKRYIVYQMDAFTRSKFKGNPAGVVLNAEGLTDVQMQQVARELNNSETAFLFPPDDADCDGVIRYFTPTREVPTCGHATIAAMSAKAIEDDLDACVLQMKTKIGVLPFEILKTEGRYKIIMTQGNIQIEAPLSDADRQQVLDCLGLSPAEIDPRCPIQVASTGHSKVMIGIKDRATLHGLNPDLNGLKLLSDIIDCNGYYVFTLDANEDDILVHGRMFAPAIGIDEDPVTGNANGPLGAYLIHNRLVETKTDIFRFKGKQGEKIKREGIVEVMVKVMEEKPKQVKIMGEATVIFKTVIEIP